MGELVIITAENMASCRIVRPLLDQLTSNIKLVMILPNLPVNDTGSRKRAWRLIFSASFRFVLLKFFEIHVHHVLAKCVGKTIWQHARSRGVPVRRYRSANDQAFLVDLASAKQLYTLSAGPAILGRAVINAAERGTLNCHGGRLPEYRGAANYIWVLLSGDRVAYSTIQKMQYELDEGPVLAERPLEINPNWSAYRLNYELSGLGGELYAQVVKALLGNMQIPQVEKRVVSAQNRGIPKRADISRLVRSGKSLVTVRDLLSLI